MMSFLGWDVIKDAGLNTSCAKPPWLFTLLVTPQHGCSFEFEKKSCVSNATWVYDLGTYQISFTMQWYGWSNEGLERGPTCVGCTIIVFCSNASPSVLHDSYWHLHRHRRSHLHHRTRGLYIYIELLEYCIKSTTIDWEITIEEKKALSI